MTAAIIEIYQRLPTEAPETGVLSWAAIVNDFKEFNSVHHVLPVEGRWATAGEAEEAPVERSRGLSKGRWVPFGRPMVCHWKGRRGTA